MNGTPAQPTVKRRWPHALLTVLVDGCGLFWVCMVIATVGPCGDAHHVRCEDDGRNMILGLVAVPSVIAIVGFNVAMLIDWIVYRCCHRSATNDLDSHPVAYPGVYPPAPQWVVDPNSPGVLRWWDGRQYTHHIAQQDSPG